MNNSVMQQKAHQLKSAVIYFCLLAFLVASIIPQAVIAQGNHTINPKAAIIKYLGFIDDKLLFHVEVDNNTTERCFITIKDEKGELLYTQEFKEAKFTKTFGIYKNELEGTNLVFTLNKGKVKQEQVFQVVTNSIVIHDVVVAKQ